MTRYGSLTMSRRASPTVDRSAGSRRGRLVIGLAAVSVAGFGAWAGGLPAPAQITVVVFVAALLLWVGTRLDETLVALGAAVVLVITGVLNDTVFFGTLAGSTIWLLIAAFVLAAGVSSTGLTTRVATRLVVRARSVRQMAHLVTAALVGTAFVVPATSGRAALAVPVFVALARVLSDRPRVVRALAVLFPTVILLSAVATLIGAGAHLVTNQILVASTGLSVTFGQWLILGVPLAVVSAHTAAELVLTLFTRSADRRVPLRVPVAAIAEQVDTPVTGRLSTAQRRAALVLAAVVLAWCTAALHGLDPALVTLAGALVLSAPHVGVVTLGDALKGVPWSLLLFMAATAALAAALITSGAAGWLACPPPSTSNTPSSTAPRTSLTPPNASCASSWSVPRHRLHRGRRRPPLVDGCLKQVEHFRDEGHRSDGQDDGSRVFSEHYIKVRGSGRPPLVREVRSPCPYLRHS